MAALTPTSTYSTQIAPTPATLLDYTGNGAKQVTYNVAWTIAAGSNGDTINILRLPKGFVLDCAASSVILQDPGTTLTVDIGDNDVLGTGLAADADRYADALVLSAGGNVGFASALATFGVAATRPYKTGSECDLVVTYDTTSSLTTTALVLFRIVGSVVN